MVLSYGNKYIHNREHTRKKLVSEKEMLEKAVSYLSEMEKHMIAKNIPIPADWYENINFKLELR